MSRALEAGLGGLELDLHRTRDGVLVVMHDESIDRTSSGEGLVAQLDWEELSELDNAYWFVPGSGEAATVGAGAASYAYRGLAPRDPAFGIVRFSEVLRMFPSAIVNVDIKQAPPNAEPYEGQVVEEILAAGAQDRVMVASFRDSSLFSVRKNNPSIATSAGPGEVSEFYFALVADPDLAVDVAKSAPYVAFQIPRFYGEIELATEAFMEAAHAAGKAVHVWTVNDERDMEALVKRGADGIVSDRPSVLSGVLGVLDCGFVLS